MHFESEPGQACNRSRNRGARLLVLCAGLFVLLSGCAQNEEEDDAPAPLEDTVQDDIKQTTETDGAGVVNDVADVVDAAEVAQQTDTSDTLGAAAASVDASPSADAMPLCTDNAPAADLCAPCTADKAHLPVPQTGNPCADMKPSKCSVGGPPAAGIAAPLPAPVASCCPAKVDFFSDGETPSPPTLTVEIGSWDDSVGVFTPYVDGGWVGLEIGPQGMFHVYVSVRVKLSGPMSPYRTVRVLARGYDGCLHIAGNSMPKLNLEPEPGDTGLWTFQPGSTPGFMAVFGYGPWHACRYCGHWLDLRVAVRDLESGQWGEGKVRVRTWLMALPKLGP